MPDRFTYDADDELTVMEQGDLAALGITPPSADPQDELAELREVVAAAVEMARGLGAEAALDLLAKALDAVEAAEEDQASGGEAEGETPSRADSATRNGAVAAAAIRSRRER